jgi:hypothetical protein
MHPTDDHDREIMHLVDQFSKERRLSMTSIDQIVSALPFTLSFSDFRSLVDYMRWRMAHPLDRGSGKDLTQ